jgi:hypothetical protein
MMYANPRTILEYLACHGPSTTQAEALALLGRPVPDQWPECRRRSRLSRPACRTRFQTMPQFIIAHLTEDVLPALLDRLSKVG